jgi:beta-galactosidase
MKRNLYLILLTVIFLAGCSEPGEQRGKMLRVEEFLNDNWYFTVDSLDKGETNEWYQPARIPGDTIRVEIPHTWNVMEGLENHYGPAWYFKSLSIPGDWKEKSIRIRFDAVYRDAKIWLNGKPVLNRKGAGYTPFEIDLSDDLSFSGENLLVIRVSNEFSDLAIPYENKFDWAADGGIIRKVRLIKTERPYIEFLHVEPVLRRNRGDLAVRIGIGGAGTGSLDVWWEIREYNQQTDKVIKEGNRKHKIEKNEIFFDLKLEGIKPWHFNQPDLYQIKVAIGDKMVLTDHSESTFGFRSLTVRDQQIIFNGEPVRLPGLEWMPGSFPGQGMAEDTASMIRMLTLLKNTNAVLTRFHWQQDEFILKWCDENGLLVQEEIPLWQAPYPGQINGEIRAIADRHLREMIGAHRNHPSIIAWGIGNEMIAQNDTVKNFLTSLKDSIADLDSSRLINYVSNTFHQNPGMDGTGIGDVLMWNDYSGLWYNMDGNGLSQEMLPGILDEFNRQIPVKPLIISEYGLCEPVFKGGDPARIRHFLEHTEVYDDLEFIGGLIYFSLNDYRTHMGEAGTGRYRQRVHGIVDLEGHAKPSYAVVKERFSPVRDLEAMFYNGNFHVTGKNHDGLPSYTLQNYEVQLYGESGQLLAKELIPEALPGQKFNIVFRELQQTVKTIRIVTGNGFLITIRNLDIQ